MKIESAIITEHHKEKFVSLRFSDGSTSLVNVLDYFPESRIYGTVGVDTYDLIEVGDDVTKEICSKEKILK